MTDEHPTEIPTDRDSILEGFRDYLLDRLGPGANPHFPEATLHASGFSDLSLTGLVRYRKDDRENEQPFALRLYRPHGVMRDFFLRFPVQYRNLELLEDTPVLSPRPRGLELDHSYFGTPFFVMERLEGHVPVERSKEDRAFMQRLSEDEGARRQMVEQLVELHTLDWRSHLFGEPDPGPGTTLPGPAGNPAVDNGLAGCDLEVPPPGRGSVELLLSDLEEQHRRAQYEPRPIVREGFEWAQKNPPEPEANVLTHGDYRPGNFLFRNGDLEGILDWEMLRIADPMHDVSWVLSPLGKGETGRFWNVFEREWFIDAYEELSPYTVTEEKLHFYHVVHLLIAIVSWESGAAAQRAGRCGDLRMARMHYSIPPMVDLLENSLDY